jgi:hypothetical protein
MKENIDQLQKMVEHLHECVATYSNAVSVMEKFNNKAVWQGTVHVFNIEGNPKSDKCYAWSHPIEGSKKRRYYAVLHIPPIDSPEKAVRASIVQDYKNINEGN